MTVHRIHAPEHRDRRTTRPGRHGSFIVRIGKGLPVFNGGMLVITGKGSATAEDRPEAIFLHLLRGHGADFRLNHLADLFPKGEG